jgi:hypothetical protein
MIRDSFMELLNAALLEHMVQDRQYCVGSSLV